MKKPLKITLLSLLGLFLIIVVLARLAGITPIGMNMHSAVYENDGIALDGYDPVAYFQGSAKVGDAAFETEWQGVIWRFSSEENKAAFIAQPQQFQPRFGGYCSKAVSTGFTAPVDPTQFAIYENELYLFSSAEVKAHFEEDPQSIISACKQNWK